MSRNFEPTDWGLVELAGRNPGTTEGRTALETLCGMYRAPLHAYVVKRGFTADQGADIVQSFFVHVIEKNSVAKASPERGKFRTFLLASIKNHLLNIERRNSAQKRGGDVTFVPLAGIDEKNSPAASTVIEAEYVYDRTWALALLSRAMDRLDSAMTLSRTRNRYALLKPFLISAESTVPYAELARQMQLAEGSIKSAVHRLRKRFGKILREEISRTVRTPEDVDEEIRDLMMILK